MQRRALHVAMAVRPDFRPRVHAIDKGIVLGNRAVRQDPHQLALQLVELLRGFGRDPVLTLGHEQVPAIVEHQPRADVGAGGKLGFLAVDHLHIHQPVALQTPARHRGAAQVAAQIGLCEGKVHQAIGREPGRQGHVEQTSLAFDIDRWHPGDRCGHPAVGADAAQSPGTFGDQHVAVGEEGQRPRMLQPGDDLGDGERALLRCVRARDRTGNGVRFARGGWRVVALARGQRRQQKQEGPQVGGTHGKDSGGTRNARLFRGMLTRRMAAGGRIGR